MAFIIIALKNNDLVSYDNRKRGIKRVIMIFIPAISISLLLLSLVSWLFWYNSYTDRHISIHIYKKVYSMNIHTRLNPHTITRKEKKTISYHLKSFFHFSPFPDLCPKVILVYISFVLNIPVLWILCYFPVLLIPLFSSVICM